MNRWIVIDQEVIMNCDLNVAWTARIVRRGYDRTCGYSLLPFRKDGSMYLDRIIQDPRILLGKLVVRGTRIPVELVLAKLAVNPHLEDLLTDYPRLTIEDVQACLEYAAMLIEKRTTPQKPDSAPPARRAV